MLNVRWLICSFVFCANFLYSIEHKEIVVVVPSYNNEKWCDLNMSSLLTQQYDNFYIIYIDDCSSDETCYKVQKKIDEYDAHDKVLFIRNKERHGALYNLYYAIHSCPDEAIIVTVDGDDWLPHPYVLNRINEEYQNPGVWLTYGQYIEYPNGAKGWSSIFNETIIQNNSYRTTDMPVSHLRTFYAGLFKAIKLEDLLYENQFYPMTWDKAMMIPMMEMAGGRFKALVDDILYVYNNANPINDHKVDQGFQFKLHHEIKNKEPYDALKNKSLSSFYETVKQRKKVGLLIVATGKYIRFVPNLIKSARTFFCGGHKLHFYILSDTTLSFSDEDVTLIYQDRLGWPYDTMMRPVMYLNNHDIWKNMDYIYSIDADMLFVDYVSDEVLYDFVMTQNPGFVDERGPYETNSISAACVSSEEYGPYVAGGFWGGRVDKVKNFLEEIKLYIDHDSQMNYIPIWHDESYINRYFLTHNATRVLSPSYCYPQTHHKKIPFKKKLLALDKNHDQMREIRS